MANNYWKFNRNVNRPIQNPPSPFDQQKQLMQAPDANSMMTMQQQQQIQDLPNPFQNPQFQNSLPDIPIADTGAAMLNALLSDETVPADVRKEFWYVFHRDNTLTFLDELRKSSKLLSFDILKIDSLNATPYYDYTFEKEVKWTAARQMFETKLDRALGNKKGQNERTVIPMTVSENITRMEDNTTGQSKEGFLKRMLNRK